jgi:GH35 family endo-1,4-beta-xylanase
MNIRQFASLQILLVAHLLLIACSGGQPGGSSSGSSSNSSSSTSSSGSISSSSSSSTSSSGLPNAARCPSRETNAFNNFAQIIPGKVEAENFDPKQNLDTTDGNLGKAYRLDTNVDIKDIAGGYALGWMDKNELVSFTVYVQSTGAYEVYLRAGAAGAGRTLRLEQCYDVLLSRIDIPAVEAPGQFKIFKAGTVQLTAGTQIIAVRVGSLEGIELDWLHVGPYAGPIDPVSTSSSSSSSSSSNSSTSSGAITHKFFVGNTTTNWQVRSDFVQYWQQITPENEGTWGAVEATRDTYNWQRLDNTYNYAKEHNILYKQHAFLWGAGLPAWLSNLNPTDAALEIEEWISEFCTRYPDIPLIDVVNEATPGHAPSAIFQRALGSDWMTKSFQLARKYCPNSVLILNDYYLERFPHDEFIAMAMPAVKSGYVDAIGLEAHGLEGFAAAELSASLDDLWNKLQLPMYITEYDSKGTDEEQLKNYQAQFPVFYNHPHIKGITLWGYVVGKTWVSGTGLIQDDGSPRPAMTWLMDYIKTHPKN